ncbi:MAG: hypothetical protein KatS3mg060_3403 [Dehalococcoidia bacterium]|jgi:protein associated with RNAse G/E|nr:MAG: hypothetical protein KatS3mg060_3403 [Dehalococcoidia bacterium]
MPTRPVEVQFRRYDGVVKRQVTASLLGEREGEVRLAVPFNSVFQTLRGPWTPATAAIYRFWRGGWHNVCTVVSPETRRPAFLYCDIHAPMEFDGGRLTVLDLDLDILVHPTLSYRVLDEEEFAANCAAFHYPSDLVAGAQSALASLEAQLQGHCGLFSDGRLFTLSADERAALGV